MRKHQWAGFGNWVVHQQLFITWESYVKGHATYILILCVFVNEESISLPSEWERKDIFSENADTSAGVVTLKNRDGTDAGDSRPPLIPGQVSFPSGVTPTGHHTYFSLLSHEHYPRSPGEGKLSLQEMMRSLKMGCLGGRSWHTESNINWQICVFPWEYLKVSTGVVSIV